MGNGWMDGWSDESRRQRQPTGKIEFSRICIWVDYRNFLTAGLQGVTFIPLPASLLRKLVFPDVCFDAS